MNSVLFGISCSSFEMEEVKAGLQTSLSSGIIVPKGGAIMADYSKYEGLTQEELIEKIRERNRKSSASQWRKTCTLTKKEGAIIDELLPQYECENISQMLRKIAKKELVITKAD